MAKIEKSLLNISGKVGDVVITKGGRYAKHIRKTVKAGSKMHEKALKFQYSRTSLLNRLASQINTAIHEISGVLKPGDFYARMQSRLRKESLDKRLVLLESLKGMEVRPMYPLNSHIIPKLTINTSARTLSIHLQIPAHPDIKKLKGCDCYSFEITVIQWMQDEDKLPKKETAFSEWIYLKKMPPVFEFSFPRQKGAIHWLAALRIRMGYREKAIESFAADGMQLAEAGSFDLREQRWLNELKAKRNSIQAERVQEKIVKRVKAKE